MKKETERREGRSRGRLTKGCCHGNGPWAGRGAANPWEMEDGQGASKCTWEGKNHLPGANRLDGASLAGLSLPARGPTPSLGAASSSVQLGLGLQPGNPAPLVLRGQSSLTPLCHCLVSALGSSQEQAGAASWLSGLEDAGCSRVPLAEPRLTWIPWSPRRRHSCA